MSVVRVGLAVGVPATGALLLSALHAAGLQAMDGLGVAESLLSPAGADSLWMPLLALGFVGVRLAAILVVPGLLALSVYGGFAATRGREGRDRPAPPDPGRRP